MPIAQLIAMRKLTFWAKLKYHPWLPSGQILQASEGKNMDWHTNVMNLLAEHDIRSDICDLEPDLGLQRAQEVITDRVKLYTMNKWRADLQVRANDQAANDKDGLSWARIYQYRDSLKPCQFIGAYGSDLLLLKARIGQWPCAMLLWKMMKCSNTCVQCGKEDADLVHDLIL